MEGNFTKGDTAVGNLIGVEPQVPTVGGVFYHQAAYYKIIEDKHESIRSALLLEPLEFRRHNLIPNLTPNLDQENTWAELKKYISLIDAHCKTWISKHTSAYWLHIYRRIKPILSPDHFGKTDHTTLCLVREAADLLFRKHGAIGTKDVGPLSNEPIKDFLEGYFYGPISTQLGGKLKSKAYFQKMRARKELVTKDFRAEDIISVFRSEGFAYEFWAATAAMRAIGKGAKARFDSDSEWFIFSEEPPEEWLFHSYDNRCASSGTFTVQTGAWIPPGGTSEAFDALTVAGYRKEADKSFGEGIFWSEEAGAFESIYTPSNFNLAHISKKKFLESTKAFHRPFEQKYNFSISELLDVMTTLDGVARFGLYKRINTQDEIASQLAQRNFNALYRGYGLISAHHCGHDIISALCGVYEKYRVIPNLNPISDEKLKGIISNLTLDPKLIAIRARGKCHPIVPIYNSGALYDFTVTIEYLSGIFYGIAAKDGEHGFEFELIAKDYFEHSGLKILHSGNLIFCDGTEREADIILEYNGKAYLVECTAIGRAVDYDISPPSATKQRWEKIVEKSEQGFSLFNLLKKECVGRNFDLSRYEITDWFVLCPHVEFIHVAQEEKFWVEKEVPRIMTPSELVAWLCR